MARCSGDWSAWLGAAAAALSLGGGAGAARGAGPELYSVRLDLEAPSAAANRLEVAVEVRVEGSPFPLRDDDEVSVTGFLLAALEVEADAAGATIVPRRFRFEEGSRLQFTDADLRLPRLFPLARIRTRGLEATVTTPDGPREIQADGTFDTMGIFVMLDRGTLEITGSLVEEPVTVDFAAEPAPVTGPGEGSLQVVPVSVRPEGVDCRAVMSIPLDLVLDVPEDIPPPASEEIPEGLSGSFSLAGLIRAQGGFTWIAPPEAPLLELVAAAPGGGVILRFDAQTGVRYVVERRPALAAGGWIAVFEQTCTQTGLLEIALPSDVRASSFRVLATRP